MYFFTFIIYFLIEYLNFHNHNIFFAFTLFSLPMNIMYPYIYVFIMIHTIHYCYLVSSRFMMYFLIR